MELDEIKAIVELMAKHNLSEFKVEAENMHLCLKRESADKGTVQQIAVPAGVTMSAPIQSPLPAVTAEAAPASPKSDENKVTIDAPIVGTFYRSASPDSESFAKVGDKVEPDTVVCIIEAMKVMNEIKSEKSGIIKEILVENAQSVEYGCPLFVIE
ncbi:MAG TPA: acetyl-CoA carboxylase biotin carboxyl carrier protein [Victivallales bacterium]|nr:acetyl-CoA carboxylase biotin carboxyl carrier protein [Victivallales bacterium]